MTIDGESYTETAELHRSMEAGIDHLVFIGTTGWRHQVYAEQMSEEELPATIEHLRRKSWMTSELLAEFEAQALLLRARVRSN